MIDFICAILIILEILVTFVAVKKLILFKNKIDDIHVVMLEKALELLKLHETVKKALKNVNKVVKILTNEKFHKIRKILITLIDTIQLIILFKSLNFSQGLKSVEYGTLKKLFTVKALEEIIKKLCSSVKNFCTI